MIGPEQSLLQQIARNLRMTLRTSLWQMNPYLVIIAGTGDGQRCRLPAVNKRNFDLNSIWARANHLSK